MRNPFNSGLKTYGAILKERINFLPWKKKPVVIDMQSSFFLLRVWGSQTPSWLIFPMILLIGDTLWIGIYWGQMQILGNFCLNRYINERWTQIRMLIWPRSSCLKKISYEHIHFLSCFWSIVVILKLPQAYIRNILFHSLPFKSVRSYIKLLVPFHYWN